MLIQHNAESTKKDASVSPLSVFTFTLNFPLLFQTPVEQQQQKNALEWPFTKAEQINQTSELSEMTGYKLMKILFLYRSMKNTILNGISEEKGRCC